MPRVADTFTQNTFSPELIKFTQARWRQLPCRMQAPIQNTGARTHKSLRRSLRPSYVGDTPGGHCARSDSMSHSARRVRSIGSCAFDQSKISKLARHRRLSSVSSC